ncbi:MAG: DUF1775 domain-containing protein [Candidatus Dormibacteraeota bacterium]|nr:DUF1775 domain-containing protein [Candidatus Dormibacteraeota bacterium]
MANLPWHALRRGWGAVIAATLLGAALLPTSALGHARVSPAVSPAGQLQLYTLAVPTEKAGVSTTQVTLAVPTGFTIDSFAPSPGWQRNVAQTNAGQVQQRVTWAGGRVPTNEDSVFSFLGQAARPGQVRFTVSQTYSDGSIVQWNGTESSQAPAPTIEAVSSLTGGGAGGGSVLAIVAVVVAVLALLGSGLALAQRGDRGRPLA